ncbi:MAG: glycerophosphodiester phosphodiesterase [Bacteroidetes bacterium]|nr:glycerophosphodiester phosphodiesterase [Bacteroidota bacterium]MDA1121365.1 glycerophosphodiester phosphodiesterase [Bacteroidota bacterium]
MQNNTEPLKLTYGLRSSLPIPFLHITCYHRARSMCRMFAENIINFFFKIIPQSGISSDQCKNLKLVAHRGYHEGKFIENTMSAFNWCLENNIWGIECDIHFTYDNVPVIHHDKHCGRLFGNPQLIISKVRFEDLRSEIPEVPSLEEVINLLGGKVHLMIEIKSSLSAEQNNTLKESLLNLRPKTDFHILSLDLDFFESIDFLNPDCFLPVAEFNLKTCAKYAIDKECDGVAGHYLLVTKSLKRMLLDKQIKTGVGFVASKNSFIREIKRNHDWLFTDYIASSSRWIRQLS